MKSRVRPASSADLPAILRVEASRPTAPGWTRGQFEEELGERRGVLAVAEEEGKVLGHACLRSVPPEAWILSVVVAEEAQGRGLGRALLSFLLGRARSAGLEKATLEVSAANARARDLYERAGFRIVGRRPKFYNDGSDALMMDLDLR